MHGHNGPPIENGPPQVKWSRTWSHYLWGGN